ncbi:hypothetical protein J2W17_005270 [Pseudomonas lini]|nr:hypothetical protein [Pseudomonas lini]
MVANDNAGCLTPSSVFWFIASVLAPTEGVKGASEPHCIPQRIFTDVVDKPRA